MTTRTEVHMELRRRRLIPVIRAKSSDIACRAADALLAGQITVAEITLTVPGALEAIAALHRKHAPDLLIGAGTVLDCTTARLAILAGARFIVSPIYDVNLITLAHQYDVCVLPGCLTPTEILAAWSGGADMVKVFPCDCMGGPAYIKALRGPMPQVEMVPTGGVNLDTVAAFLKSGAAALGVGSALVSETLTGAERWDELTELARRFHAAAMGSPR